MNLALIKRRKEQLPPHYKQKNFTSHDYNTIDHYENDLKIDGDYSFHTYRDINNVTDR